MTALLALLLLAASAQGAEPEAASGAAPSAAKTEGSAPAANVDSVPAEAKPAAASPAPKAAKLDMSKPPEVGPIEPFRMGSRIQWRLPNGLEVVLLEDRRRPLVTARLAIRSGSAAVPDELAGLAEATAELLTEGTASLTGRRIAEAAQAYGGRIGARAGPDSIVIETSGLSEAAERMLSLAAEVARFPSFPAHEVALRKKNMRDELEADRGDVEFLASVAFYRRLYRSHPYANTAPTAASIANIERKRIVEFHKRLFTPRNATLVLVGDIGYEAARRLAAAGFGSWRGDADPVEAPAVVGGHAKRTVGLVDRPGSSQSAIVVGNLAVREDHPQYFSLLMANQALGGAFSGRLIQDLRESKGYTYSVWSKLEHRLVSSIFVVRTPVLTEATQPALKSIIKHLEAVRDEGITEEELRKARSSLIGAFAMEMETQEGVADALVRQKIQRLPDDFYDTYAERIMEVRLDGVAKAARTFIRPEEMAVIVVGDAARVKQGLAEFSELPLVLLGKDGN